jgi:hypothetical protein
VDADAPLVAPASAGTATSPKVIVLPILDAELLGQLLEPLVGLVHRSLDGIDAPQGHDRSVLRWVLLLP